MRAHCQKVPLSRKLSRSHRLLYLLISSLRERKDKVKAAQHTRGDEEQEIVYQNNPGNATDFLAQKYFLFAFLVIDGTMI